LQGGGDSPVRLPAEWTRIAREIAALIGSGSRPVAKAGLRLCRRRRCGVAIRAARLSADRGAAILQALLAVRAGDLAVRLPGDWPGLAGRIAEAFNATVEAGAHRSLEVEEARRAIERETAEIERAARSKSELLATLSHELRTPLNSLLILSGQLARNPEGNLTERQVLFAETIHASGTELLDLVDDTLDLAKIESGTVVTDPSEVRLDEVCRYLERTFRPIAQAAGLDFLVGIDPRLPTAIVTDARRLQQILVNLLSNAFKFTERGQVTLTLEPAEAGWSAHQAGPGSAAGIALKVADTGIGIAADKHEIVFQAFHQADSSIGRRYAGTGLGLAIARGLSRLLGGGIGLVSSPGCGSSFTLYLPVDGTQPPSLPGPARAEALELDASTALARMRAAAEPSKPADARHLLAALRSWLQHQGR
jgi:signal transduction histidine kinase